MPFTPFQQLKLRYKASLGDLQRTLDVSFSQKKYHLDIQTLFAGFQIFLHEKEPGAEDKYFKFFDEMKSVPYEVMICAILHNENESKTQQIIIEKIEERFVTSIHHALQFAVLEYLTNANEIPRVNWYLIIRMLLDLGADPNYAGLSEHLRVPDKLLLPISQLNSAFLLTFFVTNTTDKRAQLAEDFMHLYPDVRLSQSQCEVILDNISLQDSLFKWLENNYLNYVLSFLNNNAEKLILKFIEKDDFDSAKYLIPYYEKDGKDVFVLLINKAYTYPINKKIFKFLQEHLQEKLRTYIYTNLPIMRDSHNFFTRMVQADLLEVIQAVVPDLQYYVERIVDDFNRHYLLSTKFEDIPGYKWINNIDPHVIHHFFSQRENTGKIKNLVYRLEGRDNCREFLAYNHNIDWYIHDKELSEHDKNLLNQYYQRRAKYILAFIKEHCSSIKSHNLPVLVTKLQNAQSSALQRPESKSSEVKGEEAKSSEAKSSEAKSSEAKSSEAKSSKVNIAEAKSPTYAADIFKDIYQFVSGLNEAANAVETEIYAALNSKLTDQHPLSQFVRREFDVDKFYMPFLPVLKQTLSWVPKDHLYAPRALSQVFGFLSKNLDRKAATDDRDSYPIVAL